MKLGKLAEVFEGLATTLANLDSAVGEPYCLIQCRDLVGGRVTPRRRLKGIHLDPAEVRHLAVQVGDILVALVGVEVSVVVVKKALAWCIPDVQVAIIRTASEESRVRILDYLNSDEGQRRLRSLQRGNFVKQVRVGDLRDLDLPNV